MVRGTHYPRFPMTTPATSAPLMIGVSGLRGIAGQSLTPDVATRFAAALAAHLRENHKGKSAPHVVVGRDGRAAGEIWHAAALAGLAAGGCHAIDAGIVTTPTMGVLADHVDAGLMVTASHNPQEWNGLKILLPSREKGKRHDVSASAPPKPIAESIIARFKAEPRFAPGWSAMGSISRMNEATDPHALRLLSALEPVLPFKKIKARKFRVALDSCGASGATLGQAFLEAILGCSVDQLGPYDRGLFPHIPEPTAANLKGMSKKVRASKAHVGFAQDPDADRLAILDENGRYIGEEYTLVLAALAMAEAGLIKKGSLLVVNLSTSRMIEDLAAKYGAQVLRTAVGEANVVEAMKADRKVCVLGGEGNGGVIWPQITYVRDSIAAMGLVLGLMARRNQPLSAIVDALPSYAIEKRKVDLARKEDANPGLERLTKAYAGRRIDRQDGVRVDFDDLRAWLHVRASNTEPIMRLIAEAPTTKIATRLLDDAARVIG